MRSTDIKAYRVNDFFAVPIITGSSSFAVKFDTGASRTVISIGKIKSNLNKNRLTCVKDYIVKKNIEAHKFKSASGHVITAYPAYIENAMVDNQLFDKLYGYFRFHG